MLVDRLHRTKSFGNRMATALFIFMAKENQREVLLSELHMRWSRRRQVHHSSTDIWHRTRLRVMRVSTGHHQAHRRHTPNMSCLSLLPTTHSEKRLTAGISQPEISLRILRISHWSDPHWEGLSSNFWNAWSYSVLIKLATFRTSCHTLVNKATLT